MLDASWPVTTLVPHPNFTASMYSAPAPSRSQNRPSGRPGSRTRVRPSRRGLAGRVGRSSAVACMRILFSLVGFVGSGRCRAARVLTVGEKAVNLLREN